MNDSTHSTSVNPKTLCIGIALCILVAVGIYSIVRSTDKPTEAPAIATRQLNIPLIDDYYMSVPVPAEATIVSSDGVGSWELSDGSIITVYNSSVKTGVTLVDNEVYSGKGQVERFGFGYTVVINNGNQNTIDALADVWSKQVTAIYQKSPAWLSKCKLDELPTGKNVPGVMSGRGIIMPERPNTSDSSLYMAEVWKNSPSYMSVYIKYSSIENVRSTLFNYLTVDKDLGSIPYISWYDDTDVLLAYDTENVMAAKKVTSNKFIIYSSSIDVLDYVLLNLSSEVVVMDVEE